MKIIFTSFFVALIFVAFLSPSQAEDATQTPIQAYERLSQLNRIDPLQNPHLTTAERLLSFNILDRQVRVTGQTRDIIVNTNGKIESVYMDFKDRKIGQGYYLGFDAMNMRVQPNGFALNYDQKQIADLLPEILASTATASGNADSTFSLKQMQGAIVQSASGQFFGRAKTILFKNRTPQAEAVVVELSRRQNIAVPFDALVLSAPTLNAIQPTFTLDEAYIQAANNYLKAR